MLTGTCAACAGSDRWPRHSLHVLTALLVLAGAATSASAQQRPRVYVDPVLRQLAQPEVRAHLEGVPRLGRDVPAAEQPFGGRVALQREAAGLPVRVSVFVKVTDARGVDELRALGATIGSVHHDIVTAELPLSALTQLDQLNAVHVLEAAHTVQVNNDSAMKAIGAHDVRQNLGGGWTGTAGAGVIVGVYDTGIDFRHDDFLDANGQTRLLGLWDQTRPGTPPQGFPLGHYCSRDAIQAVIDNPSDASPCPEQDTNGHGTHTAGTAAGDGSAGSATFQYAGVAPMADIIVVKGGNGTFSEANILDGLRWLESQGRVLNRPMVVNVSLGGQAGPHDGTRLYEQGIDDLARPGFIVVISSGNEGSNGNLRNRDGTPFNFAPVYIHGSGIATTGVTREFTFNVPMYNPTAGPCNDGVGFSLWYEGDDRLSITLVRPDGSSFSNDTGAAGSQDHPSGNIQVSNAPNGPHPANGAHEALIQTNDCGVSRGTPAPGTWRLRVSALGTGSGRAFHFWMTQNSLGGVARARGNIGFDNRYVVGSPGNARSAITVGASASRECWPSGSSQVCYLQVEELGDLARFSSGGPTRDGRMKPEIVAPGIAVVSALSRHANIASNRITPDQMHLSNQGTSMAAPQVTGAIALLLQVQPNLTAEEVRQVLARSAGRDQFTSRMYGTDAGAQPSDWWGFGKLHVQRALCELGSGGVMTMVSLSPSADTLPQNATLQLMACAIGVAGGLNYESSDPAVVTVDATGLVRALQPGNAFIIARAGNAADTARLTVVPPATLVASGGSLAPQNSVPGRARTMITMLALGLRVNGFEGINVESLSFGVSGADAGARLIVAEDLDRNGRIDATDRVVGTVSRGNRPADTLRVLTPVLVVPQRDSLRLLVGLELSGAAANLTRFEIQFIASETRATGVRSGVPDRLEPATVTIASTPVTTTVLEGGDLFSLSENPVRSNRVVFNFVERPRVASIYTLSGRRIIDLTRNLDQSGSVTWDLRNREGTRVAPGVYLVVFDVGGRLIREKLLVMTPRS